MNTRILGDGVVAEIAYKGWRDKRTKETWVVRGDCSQLLASPESKIKFDWGCSGKKPLYLAFAIAEDYLGNIEKAAKVHQKFNSKIIANLDLDDWHLSTQFLDRVFSELDK